MSSEVDICNLALSHIGNKAEVSSISPTDKSTEANLCVVFYPQARDLMLEGYDWNFTIRTIALADLGSPPSGWTYRYGMPNLYLRSIAVKETNDDTPQDYIIHGDDTAGRVVLTNTADASMEYIKKITDTGLYSPSFVEALAWLLASYLAGPLMKGEKTVQNALAMHRVKLELAKTQDAKAFKRGGPRQYNDTYVPSGIRARRA